MEKHIPHFCRSSAILLTLVLAMSFASPVYSLDEEEIVTDYLWQKVIDIAPPQRPKVALVLSGGGARGLAHIGVLKVLEKEKVPVDMIVGTSVGALIGALYASGAPMDRIEQMGETIRWNELTNVSDSNLVKLLISEHLLSTEKIEQYLETNIGHKRFDELKIPFACVATDLLTGERVIFREGEVAPAARASSTIPGIFDPVEFRHRYLVDGGLYDNIPTDVAKLLGADIIIAVAVSSDFSKNNISNVFMVLTQSIYIQGRMWDEERLKISDLVIQPKVNDVSAVDLGRSRECIDAGVLAARQAMPKLKSLLIGKISDDRLFR
jgi:NTE family protein